MAKSQLPPFNPADILNILPPDKLEANKDILSDPDFQAWAIAEMKANRQYSQVMRALPIAAQGGTAPSVVEEHGPLEWAKRYYPQTFSRDFTSYQKAFW